MNSKLKDQDWRFLLGALGADKCTAFVGAGANAGLLPLGPQIARMWAEEYRYPFSDDHNLAEVAQFLAVKFDNLYPKEHLARTVFRSAPPPDFSSPDEPHAVLAKLPISVYITTNYDNFMIQALEHSGKEPVREICRWNNWLKELPSIFDKQPGYRPTPAKPIVFHLHGHSDIPESIVLTEDDYLDFLWSVSKPEKLLPAQIRMALSNSSLLFIGYGLRDWSFRVLFRGLAESVESGIKRISVAQQIAPWSESAQDQEESQTYLQEYFNNMNVLIHWADIGTFLRELSTRWGDFGSQRGQSSTGEAEKVVPHASSAAHGPIANLFLSYAREDQHRAEMLYQKLVDAGFRPWMDKHDILPGERWKACIKKAIQESDFFLACLSNTAASKRGYLQREFKEALELWNEKIEDDIYLIPVRFDECQLPEALSEFQWVNIFEENGLERLIQAITIGLKRRGL